MIHHSILNKEQRLTHKEKRNGLGKELTGNEPTLVKRDYDWHGLGLDHLAFLTHGSLISTYTSLSFHLSIWGRLCPLTSTPVTHHLRPPGRYAGDGEGKGKGGDGEPRVYATLPARITFTPAPPLRFGSVPTG